MTLKDRLDKIKKKSNIEMKFLSERFETERDLIKTPIPAINYMLSGKYNGGFHGGLTTIAAPSKHFKSGILLLCMKCYLDKYPDAIAFFYDSENGASKVMFDAYGYTDEDKERIVWIEIANVEELKHNLSSLLSEDIEKGDKAFIGVDSIGNLASLKEMEDAVDGKTVADMSRARQMKSVFRVVTPFLNRYDIPMMAINHTYETMEMYSKTIMSGGTGPLLSSDSTIFIGKSQNKDGKELEGFNFNMIAHKSRFIRENTKIPLTVSFENGIDKKSGLLELGLFTETIEKKGNRYAPVFIDQETGEVELQEDLLTFKKNMTIDWFEKWVHNPKSEFISKTENYFALSNTKLISDEKSEDESDVIDGNALLKEMIENNE